MSVGQTPSQTIGPFFAIGLPWEDGPFVVPAGTPGAVWIRGRVVDGAGELVPDALVETWQADPEGRYRDAEDPGAVGDWFRGFGRSSAEPNGEWAIHTVKPGPTAGPDGSVQAPHLDVSVFARGLLKRAVTRIYFTDEAAANERDPVLASVTDPADRATLLAARTDDGYRFDIVLQGNGETVFFFVE
jgi:protocatechuate 3,4-dioxygenase alpha subunit